MGIKKCCIFIDNDVFNQAIFTKALNDVSPETICLTAANAEDAFYIMRNERIIPDYVFVELNMSGMDGMEFLKTIKKTESLKDIQVIVHAVTPPPHKVLELKECGALAIYLRPYDYFGVCNMLSLYFSAEMAGIQQN